MQSGWIFLAILFGCVLTNALDSGLVEVTTKPNNGDTGYIPKCGEGNDLGKKKCVSIYDCDPNTRTIIPTGSVDGYGLIDIRFGENKCEHYLDTCCNIPETSQSTTETDGTSTNSQTPSPSPSPPSSLTPTPATHTTVPSPPPVVNYCGTRNVEGIVFKIIGNTNEAEFGEFPWMVAILKNNPKEEKNETLLVCGGSLISPLVVLTAAHCVADTSPEEITVRAGEWDTQTTKELLPYQEKPVAEIILHEAYVGTNLRNDVALVILSEPFSRDLHIGTICLPPPGLNLQSINCFTSGWGKDYFGSKGNRQVILKKIELPLVARQICQDLLRKTRLGQYFELHESFLCAGGEKDKDACTGDGGSPLVCRDPEREGRYLQAGIVSWGIGCGEENVPGVYVDVSQFRSWVDEQMERLNFNTIPYTE